MSNFAAQIPDATLTAALGDDVIYQSDAGPVAIKAMVNLTVSPVFAVDAHLSENRKQLDVALTDVPGVKKGSIFSIDSVNYSVDDITGNDGRFAVLLLRKS